MSRIFQTIPHFVGSNATDDDAILEPEEESLFLEEDVFVFEKMDGINVTLCLVQGVPTARLKPKWRGVFGGRVERALAIYVAQRRPALEKVLQNGAELYGEWLWHQLSCRYNSLPSELIGFGMGDKRGVVWPWDKANAAMQDAGISAAKPLFTGTLGSKSKLRRSVGVSQFGDERMEGVIVQRKTRSADLWAKWVEPGYSHPKTGSLSGKKNGLA